MRAHFTVLDSWRGLAALLVAYGHLRVTGVLAGLALAPMTPRFVDFFFVLSGFVIAHSSGDRIAGSGREAMRFLVRRVFRLWPLHAFVLLLLIAYQLVLLWANSADIVTEPRAFSESFSLGWLPANLLMVQAWGMVPYNTWNEPAWSISTEMAAYLTFAAATCMLGKRAWWVLTVIGFAGAGFALAQPEVMSANVGVALARCLAGFGFGVLAYRLYTIWPDLRIRAASAVEAGVLVLVFASVTYVPDALSAVLIPIFALAVIVFSYERGALSRFLSLRPFVFLGERSYSLYLVHAVIALGIYSVAAVAGLLTGEEGGTYIGLPDPLGDVLLAGFLIATIIASAITYRFIELPGQALGKRWLARQATSPRSTAQQTPPLA